MNSLDAFQKRLRDETAAVEQEIESHQQQLEALNKRLEGLKRAAELFESEQGPISELLQAGTANGGVIIREMPTSSVAKVQKATARPNTNNAQQRRVPNTQSRRKAPAKYPSRTASHNGGGLTRLDMIAAVLKRHPRRTVRELIALLDKEYRWKTNESAITGHLYTRRDKFVHTPPDRATNRPVTWSSK
jgi:chromosome segregation ATPase